MVTPCQMRLFVGNHRLHGHRVHVGGQIDFWPDQSQDKRRFHLVTQKDVSFIGYAFRNAPVYLPIADNRVQQQDGHAHEPDDRQHKCPYIERVDTGCRIRRKHLPQKGIYRIVDGGDAAADRRGFILYVMGLEGLGTGNQAPCALEREGNRQPQGRNPPQKNGNPPGCLFQQKPQQDHSQNQPAGGDTHVQNFQK